MTGTNTDRTMERLVNWLRGCGSHSDGIFLVSYSFFRNMRKKKVCA